MSIAAPNFLFVVRLQSGFAPLGFVRMGITSFVYTFSHNIYEVTSFDVDEYDRNWSTVLFLEARNLCRHVDSTSTRFRNCNSTQDMTVKSLRKESISIIKVDDQADSAWVRCSYPSLPERPESLLRVVTQHENAQLNFPIKVVPRSASKIIVLVVNVEMWMAPRTNISLVRAALLPNLLNFSNMHCDLLRYSVTSGGLQLNATETGDQKSKATVFWR